MVVGTGLRIRKRLISGLLVLVPLGITLFVIQFVYRAASGVVEPVIKFVWHLVPGLPEVPTYVIGIVSFGLFFVLLYMVGLVATHMLGRRLIALGEAVLVRIPIVKTVYSASKQAVETFTLSNQGSGFKEVVFVDFPRPGLRAFGFVTGTVNIEGEGLRVKVFVPTAPNPTTGFVEIVPPEQVERTDVSVEDAIKMLVSGGILCPEQVAISSLDLSDGGASATVSDENGSTDPHE